MELPSLNLLPMEEEVLRMLLDGKDENSAILRQQLENARITSREMSGVGFFTYFSVPSELPRVTDPSNYELGHVDAKAENVQHGIGFVLFVRNGALDWLEGYTYHEPWPEKMIGLTFQRRAPK